MSNVIVNNCYTTTDGRNFGTDRWGAQAHQDTLNRKATEKAAFDRAVAAEAARIAAEDRAYRARVEAERVARVRREAEAKAAREASVMRTYCSLKDAERSALSRALQGMDGYYYSRTEADRIALVAFEHQKTFLNHLTPVVEFKKAHGITANKVNRAGRC